MKHSVRWLVVICIAVVLTGAWRVRHAIAPEGAGVAISDAASDAATAEDAQSTPEVASAQPEAVTRPSTKLWQAPFTTQAPSVNWDAFHEEMCEEASLLIAYRWYRHDTRDRIPVSEAEEQISAMAAWERDQIGTDVSTTTDQMYQVATDYLQIPAENATVHEVTSSDQLKDLTSAGVVVAPFAGRLLHNPHFTGDGPRYHASVLVGYTTTDFIVHDVGTRVGAAYHYDTTVLWTALHDFTPEPGAITDGAKRVLLITR